MHLKTQSRHILNPYSEESLDRKLVATRIIKVCSIDTYKNINNFEWYISVLLDLTNCRDIQFGRLICDQLIDVCIRVKDVQLFAVKSLVFNFFKLVQLSRNLQK